MSDLSDFKRLVYEPETRALRERNRALAAELSAAQEREKALREAAQEVIDKYAPGNDWQSVRKLAAALAASPADTETAE